MFDFKYTFDLGHLESLNTIISDRNFCLVSNW